MMPSTGIRSTSCRSFQLQSQRQHTLTIRCTVFSILLLWSGHLFADNHVLEAFAITEKIRVDGRLDEAAWQRAEVATDFVQLQPYEGTPASESSIVRILYGDDALYVGFHAVDSDPSAIQAQLTRRDQFSHSDWVFVAIDSYNDKRTAFQFGTNPVGVKRDSYRYDDSQRDRDWNAIWDVATEITDDGWTAEFRIPYSQLRFNGRGEQAWGIQFSRWLARSSESSNWAPLSAQDPGVVSRYGRLTGINDLRKPSRLEIVPYALSRLRQAPGEVSNPFYEENAAATELGGDLKYAVTSNLTLDMTINPDFAQVEADPAKVNLSAFETFFSEQRPFFLESADIYQLKIGYSDQLFHSRRIGRRPQGWVNTQGGFSESPEVTTISAAAKLSGKTESGWTLGVLTAQTEEAIADIVTGDGQRLTQTIEPETQYSYARIQRDFRDGRSAIGFVSTYVHRNDSAADALVLHREALTGGFDFRHRFWNDTHTLEGQVIGSRVSGSEDAIARTQRSASRYMQRPDADHLNYDPTRTSLSGVSGFVNFSKVGGNNWRYNVGGRVRTAGFEANDMGFMTQADYTASWLGAGYNEHSPSRHLRSWNVNWNLWQWVTHGGERWSLGTNVMANLQLQNYWNVSLTGTYSHGLPSVYALRGGPRMRQPSRMGLGATIRTDPRKRAQLSLKLDTVLRPESDSFSASLAPSVSWRPSGQLRLSLGTSLSRVVGDQWVTRIDRSEPHYIFGRISQRTASITTRMDLAFSRDLTLEVYLRPYVSAATYDNFRQVADPLSRDYAARFEHLDVTGEEGGYTADLDGSGETAFLGDQNFNFKQFRSNVVLRWEYRPGSTLFAVWSQGREHFERTEQFDFGEDLETLLNEPADDIFMVKVNYWLNPDSGLNL